MQSENRDQHLSVIPTMWSLVYQAHNGTAETATAARQQLLERYGGAAHRYLCKVLRDPDAADEVSQEFALQLVRGKLGGAHPDRGRFRNFLKGTLFHLISDYRRRQNQWPGQLPADDAMLAVTPDEMESDRVFLESWCDELLARAWAGLADAEAKSDQPFHTVLRFRADHPDLHSPEMAERLTAQLGRPLTPAAVRQTLHRAREKFATLLVDEVRHSLEDATPEKLEQELIELGLLEYCRPALSDVDRAHERHRT
jgi:RNA polymerase sigma-70 factor (ECF subfamily)